MRVSLKENGCPLVRQLPPVRLMQCACQGRLISSDTRGRVAFRSPGRLPVTQGLIFLALFGSNQIALFCVSEVHSFAVNAPAFTRQLGKAMDSPGILIL